MHIIKLSNFNNNILYIIIKITKFDNMRDAKL